jgi:peptidyl-dipeptidase A
MDEVTMKTWMGWLTVALTAAGTGIGMTAGADNRAEKECRRFLIRYEAVMAPLSKESNRASYDSMISGRDEDFKRSADLQVKCRKIEADPAAFAVLQGLRANNAVTDPLLKRQLDVLYNACLANQLPAADLEELVRRQTAIEQTFNTFRVRLDGTTLSDNDIDAILRGSTDSGRLEKAWKASKEIGPAVAPAIRDLARLRNRVARRLGFANFYDMQLRLNEQDPAEIDRLFDELDQLTRDAFARLKGRVDEALAVRCGVAVSALMPWHYQDRFFQEAPQISAVDLDAPYHGRDVVAIARAYFTGIGLEVGDVIARSDLFEKPGKYQHAFSSDIDRSGDVRIVVNVKPDYYWMNTLLHELGHSAYSKFTDRQLPWLLRDSAHAFTTEAVANMFGRLAIQPAWMQEAAGVPAADVERVAGAARDALRLQQTIFSRWAQVMYRFEKSLYENPDGDLNRRWWDLVEKYQLLRHPPGRDEPDWAAKIHVAIYPCYYHNYLLGELLASQLHHALAVRVLNSVAPFDASFANRPEAGRYLIEHVFKPGMRMPWAEMIEKACGEKLTPAYYARQFITGE